MTKETLIEKLPCPFCGGRPQARLSKVTHCQLHGEPKQQHIVGCFNPQCVARPVVQYGLASNSGNEDEAIAVWNNRYSVSITKEQPDGLPPVACPITPASLKLHQDLFDLGRKHERESTDLKNHKGEFMFTEEQIKYMRDRFLGWKLPKDFHPDGGIHFDKDEAKKWNSNNGTYEPYGTNLFHAGQAEEMIRYMLDGLQITDIEAQTPSTTAEQPYGDERGEYSPLA